MQKELSEAVLEQLDMDSLEFMELLVDLDLENQGPLGLEFQTEQWSAIRAEVMPLLEAHYQEMPYDPRIPLSLDERTYAALEQMNRLVIVTGRAEGKLVGYFSAVLNRHLHYDILVAAMDVYFLLPEYRKGINGALLFKAFESAMCERGVDLGLATARMDKSLGAHKIFEALGWEHSRDVFQKRMKG